MEEVKDDFYKTFSEVITEIKLSGTGISETLSEMTC
jgi:hypothetical protein